MTEALLGGGYKVAALDISVENLESLSTSYPNQLKIYSCDVTSDDDISDTIGSVSNSVSGSHV